MRSDKGNELDVKVVIDKDNKLADDEDNNSVNTDGDEEHEDVATDDDDKKDEGAYWDHENE